MDLLDFIILTLATWRISSLLVDEAGPFGILARLRWLAGVRLNEYGVAQGQNEVAEALTCIWCTSIWVGLGWAMAFWAWGDTVVWLALPPALSAGAIGVKRMA